MSSSTAFRALLALVIASMSVFICAILYFDFVERPFLYYSHVPFPVLNRQVVAGTPAPVLVTRCSREDELRSYLVSHTLVSTDTNASYVLPAATTSIRPGCQTAVSLLNVIPLGTKPGRYFIQGVSEAQGTLRTNLVQWESETFEVVAKP